jgi:2'-5' RNA ligase
VLDGLSPWCLPSAPGQPHVTLAALGTDLAVAQRAGRVLGGRCEVVVGGADSFSAAVFLQVCGGGLAAARASVLAMAADVGAPPVWVPHVTVGTYRRSVPHRQLAARLAPWRDLPPLLLTGRTGLMIVDRSGRRGELLPVPAERIRPPACKPSPIAPH